MSAVTWSRLFAIWSKKPFAWSVTDGAKRWGSRIGSRNAAPARCADRQGSKRGDTPFLPPPHRRQCDERCGGRGGGRGQPLNADGDTGHGWSGWHDQPVRHDEQGIRPVPAQAAQNAPRSEEHTSELQSLMRISYDVFCSKKTHTIHTHQTETSKHHSCTT